MWVMNLSPCRLKVYSFTKYGIHQREVSLPDCRDRVFRGGGGGGYEAEGIILLYNNNDILCHGRGEVLHLYTSSNVSHSRLL